MARVSGQQSVDFQPSGHRPSPGPVAETIRVMFAQAAVLCAGLRLDPAVGQRAVGRAVDLANMTRSSPVMETALAAVVASAQLQPFRVGKPGERIAGWPVERLALLAWDERAVLMLDELLGLDAGRVAIVMGRPAHVCTDALQRARRLLLDFGGSGACSFDGRSEVFVG